MPPSKSGMRASTNRSICGSQPAKKPNARQSKKRVEDLSRQSLAISKSKLIPPAPILSQRQSTEQMKIVSVAVVSRIVIARDMFPKLKEHFRLRTYDPANPETTYADFIQGKDDSAGCYKPTNDIRVWKLIPQGISKATDKILSWIEDSIAEAIERKHLDSFVLTVHSSDDGPPSCKNMLEAYTMSFTYGSEPQIRLTTGGGELLSMAKDKLYDLVQDVGNKIGADHEVYPPLPAKSCLTMILKHTKDCPADYYPPFFRSGTKETPKILDASQTFNGVRADLDFHSVTVGWSFGSHSLGTSEPSVPEVIQEEEAWTSRGFRNYLSATLNDETSTQASIISKYQKIGISRAMTSGTQDTLPLHNSNTLAIPGSRECIAVMLPYTQGINNLIEQARTKSGIEDYNDKELAVVDIKCVCGSLVEGDLVKCKLCSSNQHLTCYGYLDTYPQVHVCYRCLSKDLPENDKCSQEMQKLSMFRKVYYYLHHQNDSAISIGQVAQILECTEDFADMILRDMTLEVSLGINYDGRKSKGKVGEVKYSLDQVDRQALFNPAKGLQHLLGLDIGGTFQAGQSQAPTGSSLRNPPPGVTNHSIRTPEQRKFYGHDRSYMSGSSTADENTPIPVDMSSSTLDNSLLSLSSTTDPSTTSVKRKPDAASKQAVGKRSRYSYFRTRTPLYLNRDE